MLRGVVRAPSWRRQAVVRTCCGGEAKEQLDLERKTFREEREVRLAGWVEGKDRSSTLYPPMEGLPSHTLNQYREKYGELLEPEEELSGELVTLCGRVYSKRLSGKKLIFFDLRSDGGSVQVMAVINSYQPAEKGIPFERLVDTINRGDLLGRSRTLTYSDTNRVQW